MRLPIILQERDDGSGWVFDSVAEACAVPEVNDAAFDEFAAWDAAGQPLSLVVRSGNVELADDPRRPNAPDELRAALIRHAAMFGSASPESDLPALIEHARNLLTRERNARPGMLARLRAALRR